MSNITLTPQLERQIRLAARLIYQRRGRRFIGNLLSVSVKRIREWQVAFPDLWKASIAEVKAKRERFRATHPKPVSLRTITRDQVAKAAQLRARGKSFAEVCMMLGCGKLAFAAWRKRHAGLWQAAFEAAMAAVCDEVRRLAGTPAMLENIAAFSEAAESASRWCSQPGKSELFQQPARPQGGEHTLRTFLEGYYIRTCMVQPSPESLCLYRKHLTKWELLTGNPPLKSITSETLATFRDAMMAQAPRLKRGKRLSLWTVRGHLRTIQTLLDHAGPASQRNRDAAGIIGVVPWVKPPRAEMPIPKIVNDETLSKCYAAAPLMDGPVHGNVKPAAWWRALLVVAFNTGMRRRTLFGLRWRDVNFRDRIITVLPEISKSRKRQVIPMNAVVLSHLQAIQRPPGEFVFHCGWNWQRYRTSLFKLQDLAGIPKAERFQLHRLRKTCATILWAKDPGAAQLMLGHGSLAIAREHYVNAPSALIGAADAMPQPSAFTQPAPPLEVIAISKSLDSPADMPVNAKLTTSPKPKENPMSEPDALILPLAPASGSLVGETTLREIEHGVFGLLMVNDDVSRAVIEKLNSSPPEDVLGPTRELARQRLKQLASYLDRQIVSGKLDQLFMEAIETYDEMRLDMEEAAA